MNTVSVVVPTYNAADTLARCLLSLLHQTEALHEIIVVDDGSTDNSWKIAEDFARSYGQIVLCHQPNSGVSAARNKGLELATGTYIGFVDPDDYVDTTMFAQMRAAALETGALVVALEQGAVSPPNAERTARNFAAGYPMLSGPEVLSRLLLLEHPSGVHHHLYRAEALDRIRFDERVAFFEDLLFNFEVAAVLDQVALVPGHLYFYEPGARGANRSPLSDTHLSVIAACERLRLILDRECLSLDREATFLEAKCLETLVFKAATSSNVTGESMRRIRHFARQVVRRSPLLSGARPRERALVLAASASAWLLIGCVRLAIRVKRSVLPRRRPA